MPRAEPRPLGGDGFRRAVANLLREAASTADPATGKLLLRVIAEPARPKAHTPKKKRKK